MYRDISAFYYALFDMLLCFPFLYQQRKKKLGQSE